MTPQQQRFRQAAIAGFIYGLSAVIALLLLPLVGLTASYIQGVLDGSTSTLLFSNTSGWNALFDALLLFLIAPLPYALGAIFLGFTLEAVARSHQTWIYRIAQRCVMGVFSMALFLGAVFQYAFMRNPSPVRLDLLHLILSIAFIYSITFSCATMAMIIEGYLARTLPTWVCLILGCVELFLLIFQFVTLNPDVHAVNIILYYTFNSIRNILLAAYFWIASLPRQSIESMETVTPT